jgi:hypothetical protein
MTVTSPEAPRRPAPKPVDREKLQRRAVWLMFSFVVLTLAAVTVFRLSGAEPIAQPPTTAIAAERLVLLERPERNGPVFVRDAETGRLMARSDRNKNGFIDVIGRVVDRQRLVDFESLHAHVRFNNGAVIYPGDEVKVQRTRDHGALRRGRPRGPRGHDRPRQQAGTALDTPDRGFRGHGTVRIFLLRGGDAL